VLTCCACVSAVKVAAAVSVCGPVATSKVAGTLCAWLHKLVCMTMLMLDQDTCLWQANCRAKLGWLTAQHSLVSIALSLVGVLASQVACGCDHIGHAGSSRKRQRTYANNLWCTIT
jgi:hypothetical protein